MWVLWIIILTVGSSAGNSNYPALITSKLWFGDRSTCEVAQQAIIANETRRVWGAYQ